MRWPVSILSLITFAAGYYYLFLSRSAQMLGGVEAAPANRRRQAWRKVNGVLLLLLSVGVFFGAAVIDPHARPRLFILDWMGVFVALIGSVSLAFFDARWTARLRRGKSRA